MFVPIRENGSRPTATNLKKLPLRSANIFWGGVPFARDPKKRNMSQSQIAQLLGTLFNPLCDLDCPPFYKIFNRRVYEERSRNTGTLTPPTLLNDKLLYGSGDFLDFGIGCINA